jgi:hypothetical protein
VGLSSTPHQQIQVQPEESESPASLRHTQRLRRSEMGADSLTQSPWLRHPDAKSPAKNQSVNDETTPAPRMIAMSRIQFIPRVPRTRSDHTLYGWLCARPVRSLLELPSQSLPSRVTYPARMSDHRSARVTDNPETILSRALNQPSGRLYC